MGRVGTLAEFRDESVQAQRINAILVAGFGAVALLIAAVGLAGVLGFSVSQRTGEIGIRMSLGADGASVRRMVVGEGVRLLAAGLAIGIIGSLLATRVLSEMLFEVSAVDPTTLAVVVLVLGGVGVTAAWVPAAKASRVDPLDALRREGY